MRNAETNLEKQLLGFLFDLRIDFIEIQSFSRLSENIVYTNGKKLYK